MLILTRKQSQQIHIGEEIKVRVIEIKGGQVRLGIDAPRRYAIHREEIYLRIQAENAAAAPTRFAGFRRLLGMRGGLVGQNQKGG